MTDTLHVPAPASNGGADPKPARGRKPKASSDRVTITGVTYLDHIHGDQFVTLDGRLVRIADPDLADRLRADIKAGKGKDGTGRIRPTVVDFPEA